MWISGAKAFGWGLMEDMNLWGITWYCFLTHHQDEIRSKSLIINARGFLIKTVWKIAVTFGFPTVKHFQYFSEEEKMGLAKACITIYLNCVSLSTKKKKRGRNGFNENVFSTRNCEISHRMIILSKFLFSLIQEVLKYRLVQIWYWKYKSLLLDFSNINWWAALWHIWSCLASCRWRLRSNLFSTHTGSRKKTHYFKYKKTC